MTHQEFAQAVMAEWNLVPGQMCQSCYCHWYHYTISSGIPFPENKIIGEYMLRKGEAVFVLYKQDGTEIVYEAH
jgi:hypothetical protein